MCIAPKIDGLAKTSMAGSQLLPSLPRNAYCIVAYPWYILFCILASIAGTFYLVYCWEMLLHSILSIAENRLNILSCILLYTLYISGIRKEHFVLYIVGT